MSPRRQLHDRYFRQAKAEGYLARSAYKLKEINDKKRLIRRADRVLDLGCAPGSWLQVAAEAVGDRGVVVGLDLQEIDGPFAPNVVALRGDVFKIDPAALLQLGGISAPVEPGFDVVLSDMAPSTAGGGGGSADHFRSVDLCRRVLELLPAVLRVGGNLAMKVFEGEAYGDLLKETGRLFSEARGFKPAASREVSREMYVVGKGFRGRNRQSKGSGSQGGAANGEAGKGGGA
jgi:23S rRNA (uridine2552-2'-O)-methyltransferase